MNRQLENRLCKKHPKTYLLMTMGKNNYNAFLKRKNEWITLFRKNYPNSFKTTL